VSEIKRYVFREHYRSDYLTEVGSETTRDGCVEYGTELVKAFDHDREIAQRDARIGELEAQARLYKFIAAPALGGTDYVEKIAANFPNPFDAFDEAERVRSTRLDETIAACMAPQKERWATLEAERDTAREQLRNARKHIDAYLKEQST
jgi:hypothetical protein